MAPHYLVHVGDDRKVLLPIPGAKRILDRLKRTCVGRDLPDAAAFARFDKATKQREACAMPSACLPPEWCRKLARRRSAR